LHKKFFKPSINILYNINSHENAVQEIINNFIKIDVTQEIINNFIKIDVTDEVNKMYVAKLSTSNCIINKTLDPKNNNNNLMVCMSGNTPNYNVDDPMNLDTYTDSVISEDSDSNYPYIE
jgi:hypothetical protein